MAGIAFAYLIGVAISVKSADTAFNAGVVYTIPTVIAGTTRTTATVVTTGAIGAIGGTGGLFLANPTDADISVVAGAVGVTFLPVPAFGRFFADIVVIAFQPDIAGTVLVTLLSQCASRRRNNAGPVVAFQPFVAGVVRVASIAERAFALSLRIIIAAVTGEEHKHRRKP